MWVTKYLSYIEIWLPMLAVILVSAIFLRRKIYRELPFFFIYIVSAWIVGLLRYATYSIGRTAYFYTYWISELAGAVIVSLALYEVFFRRLFQRFYKVRFYRNLFPAVALIILVLMINTALQAADRKAAFLRASHALDVMRTAVLFFFVALMALMGRQWTRYDFGIALGFGLQASAALLNAALSIQTHLSPTILGTIEQVAYNVACIIWLITFWKPEKSLVPSTSEPQSKDALHQARTWEEALKDFLTPGKR